MDERKGIPTKTQKALFARSGNVCAMTHCKEVLVTGMNTGDGYFIKGEIAHIYPSSSDSKAPRGEYVLPNSTDVNDLENLILLCPNHHKLVDRDTDEYTPEKLIRIKARHEAEVDQKHSEIKDFRNPELLEYLFNQIPVEYITPTDFENTRILLEAYDIKRIFKDNVAFQVNNKNLFYIGYGLASYYHCVEKLEEAVDILDDCLNMHSKIFKSDIEEGNEIMRLLLHKRFGHLDLNQRALDFCLSVYGRLHEYSIMANICHACELLRTDRLDEAEKELNQCVKNLQVSGKDNHSKSRAYLDLQLGKLFYKRALSERDPPKMASISLDYLNEAMLKFNSLNEKRLTRYYINFFLWKSYLLINDSKAAIENYKLAKAFFCHSPHIGMCHYNGENLLQELGIKQRQTIKFK